MAKVPEALGPFTGELQRNWGWIFGLGVLFLILGCIGLGMVVGLTLVSMYFFAVLLLLSGLGHVVDAFKYRDWQGTIWQAFIAVLYLGASFTVFYDPFLASVLITFILAGFLFVIGFARIMMALSLQGAKGWGWLLLAGFAAIVLSLMIFMQWPVSGLWVIGLFIAIEMIVNGWTYIFIGLSLRNA